MSRVLEAGNYEHVLGSNEQGASFNIRSKKQGAGNREQGEKSMEQRAGKRSREQ